jgi:plasmid stabilization system protein ParE
MSLRPGISGRAEADLTHQYRWYFANAGIDVADRFLAGFDLTVDQLARQPGMGWARKFRAPELAGIRSFPVAGHFAAHLVFYRVRGEELTIGVMHGGRDIPRRLLEPPED